MLIADVLLIWQITPDFLRNHKSHRFYGHPFFGFRDYQPLATIVVLFKTIVIFSPPFRGKEFSDVPDAISILCFILLTPKYHPILTHPSDRLHYVSSHLDFDWRETPGVYAGGYLPAIRCVTHKIPSQNPPSPRRWESVFVPTCLRGGGSRYPLITPFDGTDNNLLDHQSPWWVSSCLVCFKPTSSMRVHTESLSNPNNFDRNRIPC